jgi:gliding motility-associated-like protein
MGVKELHYFKIYNRWGQLLFDSKTERPGWNGNFNGMSQPTQVVVWIAEGLGVDGRIYTRKGTSTLVR